MNALPVVALVLMSSTGQAKPITSGFVIKEFQPDIAQGGRASAIAVHPFDDSIILVASESGGLFRSVDRGASWKHVDSLPVHWMRAVAFAPKDPNIVIATSGEIRPGPGLGDFNASNGAGIWKSTDGGANWEQVPSPSPPPGVSTRFSAQGISVAPDSGEIYVGTEFGVSKSADKGKTWTQLSPFKFGETSRQVVSVLAQLGGIVLAGGPSGVRRSTDSGVTWKAPTKSPGVVVAPDVNALAPSPFLSSQAFVVNSSSRLFVTNDAGLTWLPIKTAPAAPGSPCGGNSFVKTTGGVSGFPPMQSLHLYYSNRCNAFHLLTKAPLGSASFSYAEPWTVFPEDHDDTRDLAFDKTGEPLLLATDGGLHKKLPASDFWKLTGGGSAGYNALQITEIRGQWIESLGNFDMYFGTQDNKFWYSSNDGSSWPRAVGIEGGFIEVARRVATPADTVVVYQESGAGFYVSGRGYAGPPEGVFWRSPSNFKGPPKLIGQSRYVQSVASSSKFEEGYAFTGDTGASWSQYAKFDAYLYGLPQLSAAPSSLTSGSLDVLYQAIKVSSGSFDRVHLVRTVQKPFSDEADAFFPAMKGFGGIGTSPTEFIFYPVFAVDPGNAGHLIASDIDNNKMMETWTGGNTWAEMPALTTLVTDGGRLLFSNSFFSQVSTVSFSKDDPHWVAVGTVENGVFISGDRGATWSKVPGSERATFITSLEWRTDQSLVAATYGRGLWRLDWWISISPEDLTCPAPCFRTSFTPPFVIQDISELPEGIFVVGGQLQGARLSQSIVSEVFVSPGGSIHVAMNRGQLPGPLKITESRQWVGIEGRNDGNAPERGHVVTGLALSPEGRVMGVVFSDQPLSRRTEGRASTAEELRDNPRSPIEGKSYLWIAPGARLSTGIATPGQPVLVRGRNFPVGKAMDILLNGIPIQRIAASRRGEIAATIFAPKAFGLHRISVRARPGTNDIDGVMLKVSHSD